ncbi:MAG: DnaD domain protein [Clostridia bacterium]|nr:DnaD domain protein [Clostridia bacterium]
MNSIINPGVFSATFALPSGVVDNHLKIATAAQLKVLLYIFRNSNEELSTEQIASALSLHTEEVEDAIGYWAGAGFFNAPTKAVANPKATTKKARMQSEKPTREEVARLADTDETLQFLYREAQSIFCRGLKQNEASLIAWLYSDEGMEASVILMLLRLAKKENKINLRYIENTAINWIDSGVETLADAEAKMTEELLYDQCWKLVCAAFGIEKRKPSKNEKELSFKWVNEWKFDRAILVKAYEICVDATGKFSIPYIKVILEKWHSLGVKALEDIDALQQKEQKDDDSLEDELIKKIINSED